MATSQSNKQFARNMLEVLKDYLTTGNSIGVFVSGKVGVGKSSLINSLCGAELTEENSTVKPVTADVVSYTISINTPLPDKANETTLFTAWDSPGFGDIYIDAEGMEKRLEQLKHAIDKADVLLYCIRIDLRIDSSDFQGIVDITKMMGPTIWKKAVFALTFANELKIPKKSQFTSLVEYLHFKIQEWKDGILDALTKLRVPSQILSDISIVPVGYEDENPPDRNDWYTPFWMELFKKTRETGKPGLLRLTWSRFNCEEDKAPNFNRPSNSSTLPVQLFNENEGVTNLINMGGLAEYLPQDSLSSLKSQTTPTATGGSSPQKQRTPNIPPNPQPNGEPYQYPATNVPRRSPYLPPPLHTQPQSNVEIKHNPRRPTMEVGNPPHTPQDVKLPTTARVETTTSIDRAVEPEPGTPRWKKALKIGGLIGCSTVAGALIGMLIGIVGGPPGMAIGIGIGAAAGGGVGAGGLITNALFKHWKKKKLDQKQQHDTEAAQAAVTQDNPAINT